MSNDDFCQTKLTNVTKILNSDQDFIRRKFLSDKYLSNKVLTVAASHLVQIPRRTFADRTSLSKIKVQVTITSFKRHPLYILTFPSRWNFVVWVSFVICLSSAPRFTRLETGFYVKPGLLIHSIIVLRFRIIIYSLEHTS